jgi:hypothetical protein
MERKPAELLHFSHPIRWNRGQQWITKIFGMPSRHTTSRKAVSIGKLILLPMNLVRNQIRNKLDGETGKFTFGRISINLGLGIIRIPVWYNIFVH